MELARAEIENDSHYHLGFDFDFHYQNDLGTKKSLKERDSDNRKVWGKKGVLMYGVLLRYRCECFGMVLALIHPYITQDFDTLITLHKNLFS